MQNLCIAECQGVRVLTTKQIAEWYGTTARVISNNFNNNKRKYAEGRHYITLKGEGLQTFLRSYKIGVQNQSRIRLLYLWTEKGALLHAKSLNTDKAWEVYDYLVDFYFRAKEMQVGQTGNLVVDVPGNIKIQAAIKGVRDYMTTTDVLLQGYSTCHCEDTHRVYADVLKHMSVKMQSKILDLLELQPELIVKQ